MATMKRSTKKRAKKKQAKKAALPRGKRGQPTKLTPETQALIVEVLKEGNYRRVAAGCVGIDEVTLSHWMKRGREGIAEDRDDIYVQFFLAVTAAEHDAHRLMVKAVTAAAKQDYKAALEYLSRKFPKEWAKVDRMKVQGDPDAPIAMRHSGRISVETDDRLEKYRPVLEKLARQQAAEPVQAEKEAGEAA